MSILFAVVGLGLLIVLHEGGHFLVARLCGMRVERFSIGFGKPLLSFKRGDTIYQIAPIPLGGFVQITGLNPHEEFDVNDPYVYPNRPHWMRLAVLVAGPAANYLTACLLALGIFVGYGKITSTSKIDEVMPNTPAAAAGLQAGDVLLEANGKAVSTNNPIRNIIAEGKGAPVLIKIERQGKAQPVTVTPAKDPKSGDYLIGVKLGQVLAPVPFTEAAKEALVLPVLASADMLKGLYDMITRKQKANLSGPLGIAGEMKRAADRGAFSFLQLLMMLSVYLGLFNLLPVPALDGGRALFQGINALRSKDVNPKTEATVHMVGMVLLFGVFVLVTLKDIREIVTRLLT